MNDSHHVRDDLVDLLLGDIDEPRREDIERHLGRCSECAASRERLRLVQQTIVAAPLEPLPPPSLQEEVFLRVAHAPTMQLLRDAPLEPEPRADLPDRVFGDPRLTRVVSLDEARASKRTRIVRGSLLGAAAILIGALVFSVVQIAGLNDKIERLENSPVAEGHPEQVVELTGDGVKSDLELVHFRHDNYRLQLETDGFPVQKPGHHYEVWLIGAGGNETLAGSFRIEYRDRVTFILNVGVNPSEFTDVEIVEEPDVGGPQREGEVVARGRIDPSQLEHSGDH